jgi:NAD(P)H-nitrite reductase large subunit
MEGVLGKEVGEMLLNEHKNNGIKLQMNSEVSEITKGADGQVTGVVLANGKKLDVDMVVLGAGVAPRTEFLARTECGIKMDEAGAVVCDPFL